jgi:hypothetical protein
MDLNATDNESGSASVETGDAIYEGDYPPGPSVSEPEPTDSADARQAAFPPGPSVSEPEPTDSADAGADASDDLDVDPSEAAEVTRARQGADLAPCI